MKIVVGLGNPGAEYRHTRHNVGFIVVDGFAREHRCRFTVRRCKSLIARTAIGGSRVTLMKPLTFVNLSGEAVACALRAVKGEPGDLLVVMDDVNLPFGRVRIRMRGGDGGHKGLRSIISCVGSEEFARLRVGIGVDELPEDLTDFVLDDFSEDEAAKLPELVATCCRAVEALVTRGIEEAMNEFNCRP